MIGIEVLPRAGACRPRETAYVFSHRPALARPLTALLCSSASCLQIGGNREESLRPGLGRPSPPLHHTPRGARPPPYVRFHALSAGMGRTSALTDQEALMHTAMRQRWVGEYAQAVRTWSSSCQPETTKKDIPQCSSSVDVNEGPQFLASPASSGVH